MDVTYPDKAEQPEKEDQAHNRRDNIISTTPRRIVSTRIPPRASRIRGIIAGNSPTKKKRE